jgi:hypothetical protein
MASHLENLPGKVEEGTSYACLCSLHPTILSEARHSPHGVTQKLAHDCFEVCGGQRLVSATCSIQ